MAVLGVEGFSSLLPSLITASNFHAYLDENINLRLIIHGLQEITKSGHMNIKVVIFVHSTVNFSFIL